MRPLALATALVVAAPQVAVADEEPGDDATSESKSDPKEHHKHKRKHAEPAKGVTWTAEAEATAGVLTGEGVVRNTGGFLRLGGKVTPQLERERWRFRAPLSLSDRETFGASFPERDVELAPDARWRKGPRLHVTMQLGLSETWRPGWPDPYQPLGGGRLADTSRRSHLDVFAGVEVGGIPVRHHHARLKYTIRNVDYVADDSYNPIDAPTHLVPGSHLENELKGSWTYFGDDYKLGGQLDLSYQAYDDLYARDAGTGLTHAGAGGPPPNPLQTLFDVEPALVAELTRGALELDASYGIGLQDDTYQGYYSYVEQHPEVSAKLEQHAFTVEASAELRWRSYGANSYAVNPPSHPALDFGDRRSDRTFDADLDVRVPVGGGLSAIAGVSLRVRRSNFPDYVPNVFPAGSQYAIDWDYDDVTAFAGVSWERGAGDDE